MRRHRFVVPLAAFITMMMMLGGTSAAIFAQDATPAASPGASPTAGTYEVERSITREEYALQLLETYPMEEVGSPGGEVIWGQPSDLSTVNPMVAADEPTNPFLYTLIFESLTSTNPVDGQPVPGLANSWERASDGVTYTFNLNQDAKWHDGEDFTADDVKFSLDAQLSPETGSQYTSTVDAAVASYRVVDENTFEVVTDGPRAAFLFDFVLPIMPMHIWESVPFANWAQDPGSTGQDPSRVVGTGPFTFVEWVQGDHVTVERNDEYWDTVSNQVPNIDRFTMQVYPDETTLVQALRTGQVDFYEDLPPAEIQDLETTEGINVETFETFDFSYFAYNLDPAKTPLFQDKEVRQALFQALDRQAIVDNIFLGYGEVAVGTQSILSEAYSPESIENPYSFDLEAARALLEQAGWVDSDGDGVVEKDGNPLRFEMMFTESVATYEQMVPYMQQQWREIGAEMIPAPVPFPTLLEANNETHDYDMVLLGFSWVADPDQKSMFACDQYAGGFNSSKYCNPAYDELAYAADRELDPERRLQLLIDAAAIAWDELPLAIYKFTVDGAGSVDRLHNFHPTDYTNAVWSIPFMWVEQ